MQGIVIFFAIQYHGIALEWWGTSVSYEGCDGIRCTLLPIPESGHFGPVSVSRYLLCWTRIADCRALATRALASSTRAGLRVVSAWSRMLYEWGPAGRCWSGWPQRSSPRMHIYCDSVVTYCDDASISFSFERSLPTASRGSAAA